MKQQILLLAITALAISSCTTAYRTGQTPDDIYFSQARPQDEYVQVNNNTDKYRYIDDYYDDRYLRMKVRNHAQWDNLNDWYSYDRYSYRYTNFYGSYYNPYTSWNYYYNPYCKPNTFVVIHPSTPASQISYVAPRLFNLNSYTNTNYNTVNNVIKGNTRSGNNSNQFYNNSNNTGFSNTLKQIFSNGNNNSNTYTPPTRTYNPTNSNNNSSSSSSSSSSGSSSGEVSRPKRGGN